MQNNRRLTSNLKPLLIAIIVIIALLIIRAQIAPEALTDKEILAKTEWSEEELVRTLSKRTPDMDREFDNEVRTHLRKAMESLDKDSRERIIENVMTNRMQQLERQLTAVDEQARTNLIEKLTSRVKKGRERMEKLSEKEKKEIKDRMSGRDKEKARQMQTKILNSLSPDARQALAPVMREWAETLDQL